MKHFRIVLGLAALTACASSGSTPSPESQPGELRSAQTPARGRNRDLITQADIAADPALRSQTVLDVIRSLRPQFLTDRGGGMTSLDTLTPGKVISRGDPESGKVHASIDNSSIVAISELRGVHAANVLEIRYLNIAQAMQKFGPNARQGPVILVLTAK